MSAEGSEPTTTTSAPHGHHAATARVWWRGFQRIAPWLAVLAAACATLSSAYSFYRSMWLHAGAWSAPLDDVFIHFDFARQVARGRGLEWSPGNGYSSGATSLLYAGVLGLGYWVTRSDDAMFVVAAVLAMVSTFVALFAYTRGLQRSGATRDLGYFALPATFFCVGALDWSLWSGMEVALYVGLHGLAFAQWMARRSRPSHDHGWRSDALFAALLMLQVATRPESAVTVGLFALDEAWRKGSWRLRARHLVVLLLPTVLLMVGQNLTNRLLTGESSAYGALVKLAWNNPTLSLENKLVNYLENLQHAFRRVFYTHLAAVPHGGALFILLALIPLAHRRLRVPARLLWVQMIVWFFVVAVNGQVRWQNERYLMPAVAWLMVLVGYGLAALWGNLRGRRGLSGRNLRWVLLGGMVMFCTLPRPGYSAFGQHPPDWVLGSAVLRAVCSTYTLLALLLLLLWLGFVRPPQSSATPRATRLRALAGGLAVLTGLCSLHIFTEHNVRQQRWYFGRASKNILEQQYALGKWLREIRPKMQTEDPRVLVGDAGAILYGSDWRGLDIIGLGGYHKLPFARAGALGLGASLEILERVPPRDRPELLAIFPSWWGPLPLFFSRGVVRRFQLDDNVICGDFEHVVYAADWSLFGSGDTPRSLDPAMRLLDTLDTADIVSEREHDYRYFPTHMNGYVDFKILPDPAGGQNDIFDAGRRLGPGSWEKFVLRGADPSRHAQLVLRTAPEGKQELMVTVGATKQRLELEETGSYVESVIPVEPRPDGSIEVMIEVIGHRDLVDYHVFFAQ